MFWKGPPWKFRDFRRRLWRLAALAWLILAPLSRAQTNDAASSREVSVFNFGQATASLEAVSRETSVFNFGQSTANYEAVSREVSVFHLGQPAASFEAVSREVSVFNFGQANANFEAVSREVSLFDFGQPVAGIEAISREVSEYNYGSNRLNVAVGSTVVLAGTSGGVPVSLTTIVPLSNVLVTVDFPPDLLSNWTVQAQAPLSGTLQVSNNSRMYLTFSGASGQMIMNTQQLGQISFTSESNQPSAFLPLPVTSVAALLVNAISNAPSKTTAQNGEVVVIHTNSLLREYRGTNGTVYLALYGFSGTNYTIQSATNLTPPVNWQDAYTLVPSNLVAISPNMPTTNQATFYRAKQ